MTKTLGQDTDTDLPSLESSEVSEGADALKRFVRSLETLGLDALRQAWAERWGYAPRLRSPDLMRQLIAWRVQAEHFGGLDEQIEGLLTSRRKLPHVSLPPGTRLRREFRGVLHEVEALEEGYRYGSRTFPHLTAVAEAITGTHWSGPKFFGLRAKEGAA